MKFADRVENVSPSLTLKINSKAKLLMSEGKNIINMSAGEPDLDTPEIVKTKAKIAIDSGYTKYTTVSGIKPLKQAVAKRYEKKFGVDIPINSILVSSGAKHSIFNIVQTLCNPEDEVIIPSPYWVSYPEIVKLALAKPVFIDTSTTDYILSPDAFDAAITDKTKLLILNSPNNPTGVIYPESVKSEISKIVNKKGIYCISDEIYDELIYTDTEHRTMLDSPINRIIAINGVSKTFSMTGWRIGYTIASKEIIERATKLQAHSTSCASSISQYAALSALEEGAQFPKDMRREFDKRRKMVVELLTKIDGLTFPKPEGAFYVFFNVSKFYNAKIRNSVEMAEYLLDEYQIALVPGSAFGDDKSLRLSYTLPLKSLTEGIKRLSNGILNVRR